MRVKWAVGTEHSMRHLVDENEAALEATRIRITTRSGEDVVQRSRYEERLDRRQIRRSEDERKTRKKKV